MNSTFVIALGVPARHLEAIATVRDRITVQMPRDFHQTWASWIPICRTAHLDQEALKMFDGLLQEELRAPRVPSIVPTRFVDRGSYLGIEFAGADQFVARLRETTTSILPRVELDPLPLTMPLVTSSRPGAATAAMKLTEHLVLPHEVLPLTDLLVFSQKGKDNTWTREHGFELRKLAA